MEAWRQRLTRQEKNRVEQRTDLTPTGLLMEGVYTHSALFLRLLGEDECNGDITTAISEIADRQLFQVQYRESFAALLRA